MDSNLRSAISEHALSVYPAECCGLVVAGQYIPCRNIAQPATEAFSIAPEDYANAEELGDIQAIVHSHPGDHARPSEADLTVCEAAGVPLWVIVSLGAQADGSVAIEDWCEFGPTGYEAPLIGCEFSHGTNDCYGLIRRYYRAAYGVVLRDFDRSGHWWNDGHSSLYVDGYEAAGFTALRLDTEPQPGDVLLMKIRSRNNVPNHAAVYLGADMILHHPWNAPSRRDSLPRYRDHVTHILRYKEELSQTQFDVSASTAH
ncbi:Mov34/MPN/PAD-1 family protein [Pararobbsia alpina]|uniref:C40 family peptidase n=1 Tax=Pararobbsia alpina TaxID=621374 RepID=UPI001583F713